MVQHSVGLHAVRAVAATSIVTVIHVTHVNRANLVIHVIRVTHAIYVNRVVDLEEKNQGKDQEIIDFQMIFRQEIIGIIHHRLIMISKIHRRLWQRNERLILAWRELGENIKYVQSYFYLASSVAQRLALWRLNDEVPSSIPDRTHLGY